MFLISLFLAIYTKRSFKKERKKGREEESIPSLFETILDGIFLDGIFGGKQKKFRFCFNEHKLRRWRKYKQDRNKKAEVEKERKRESGGSRREKQRNRDGERWKGRRARSIVKR